MSIAEYLEVIKNFTTTDYLFYLFILVGSWWLLWELVPDGLKQYWKYIAKDKKDQKEGRRRKWSFNFRK